MIENNTKHSLTIGFIKKFGPTKFCSVWQNIKFCQTNIWQNLKYFDSTVDLLVHVLQCFETLMFNISYLFLNLQIG